LKLHTAEELKTTFITFYRNALSSFWESSLNFLSNNMKKHYKVWYSQGEARCPNLNCKKHSLKGQSETNHL